MADDRSVEPRVLNLGFVIWRVHGAWGHAL